MRIVVVSDTHGPRRWKSMPQGLVEPIREADLVLHAGDVCRPQVLDEIASLGTPMHVVMGNNDGPDIRDFGATPTLELDLDGFRLAMIHISGPKEGRANRMRKRFPDVDLVVFGHSHKPVDDATGAVHLFNPGSPTDPRKEPVGTYGVLEIGDGRLVRHEIVELG